jgi:hypothetical protein
MATNPTLGGEPLFITHAVDLIKSANSKLSKDPDEWEQEIMDYLHEQHPYIAEHKVVVAMHKVDPDEGHGVGHVKIGEKVVLPIVVDGNRLQPLDLFVAEDRLQPLTKAAFDAAVQGHSFGKAVKPGKGESQDSSITYTTLPPFDGKYAYGSLRYTQDQVVDALDRINDVGQLALCLDNPWFSEVAGEFVKRATADVPTEEQPELRTARPVRIRPFTKVAKVGVYDVMTDQGELTGVVFDHHLTFGRGGYVDKGPKTFVGLDKAAHAYSMRDEIGGRPATHGVVASDRGMTKRAALALIKDDIGVVSEPFTVLDTADRGTLVEADDGRRWTIRTEPDTFYKEAGDQVFVNDDWSILPIGDAVEVFNSRVANQHQIPTGTASLDKVGNRIRVLNPGNVDFLENTPAEGVPFEKVGELLADLDEEDRAEIGSSLLVYGNAFIQVSQPLEKAAGRPYEFSSIDADELATMTRAAGLFITPELCKRAKVEEEKAKKTIDAILGLNFLSEENMHKFVDHVDNLEEAKDCVAELLLASRLGLAIDSQPLRTALFSLDAVSRDLRELKNAVTAK